MVSKTQIAILEKRAEGAPEGNRNALKFKTAEARKEVCAALIEHLTGGYDWESFVPCNKQTIWYYIENFPDDFPEDGILEAVRKGKLKYEQILIDMADGENTKGSAAAAIFLAKNKIGYTDKRELELTNNKKSKPLDATAANLMDAQDLRMKLIKGVVVEDDDTGSDDD